MFIQNAKKYLESYGGSYVPDFGFSPMTFDESQPKNWGAIADFITNQKNQAVKK